MPPDAARSKTLMGIGGFVLGLVFLALGLGLYLCKKGLRFEEIVLESQAGRGLVCLHHLKYNRKHAQTEQKNLKLKA
ncbi:hypothetical protein TURU_001028 [Turdus rufiventris]|nr:hypothetical protein TURU_001028 [Turdus rufiventris]